MIDVINEEKVTAIILRKISDSIEILAFFFDNSNYKYLRLPGGGVEKNETALEAAFREVEEESGIKKESLVYLRKIGKLEYFKPHIHKKVVMHNYLFLINTDLDNSFKYTVTSEGKDNDLIFNYSWIDKSKISEIDPELSQLINKYNLPELFIDPYDWGLMNSKLTLSPHNSQWTRIYEFEEIEIRENMLDEIIIEHIGSTSVKDLYSKPIIDILIGFTDKTDINNMINKLINMGYKFHGEHGINRRYYFTKGNDKFTLFHVHAFQIDEPSYKKHLQIRNNLMNNDNLRTKYQKYKMSSQNIPRSEYTENKQEIMNEILNIGN